MAPCFHIPRALSLFFLPLKIMDEQPKDWTLPTTERFLSWNGAEFQSTREDIGNGVEWAIQDDRHAVIMHLGGTMRALKTELDGHGMSFEPATAGEIWIVPADSKYTALAHGQTIHYAVLFLDTSTIGGLLPDGRTFAGIVPLHGVRDEFCFHAACRLIDATEQNDDVSQMLAESLEQSLSLNLYRSYGERSLKEAKTCNTLPANCNTIARLRSYIHDNLADKITVAGMAESASIPVSRLHDSFCQWFGESPGQYVISQRLRRVQWLLTHSNDDITSIALETGFSSHSHLTTAFSQRLGIAPSAFRQRWRQGSDDRH